MKKSSQDRKLPCMKGQCEELSDEAISLSC